MFLPVIISNWPEWSPLERRSPAPAVRQTHERPLIQPAPLSSDPTPDVTSQPNHERSVIQVQSRRGRRFERSGFRSGVNEGKGI